MHTYTRHHVKFTTNTKEHKTWSVFNLWEFRVITLYV